jgi:hypothetical protein
VDLGGPAAVVLEHEADLVDVVAGFGDRLARVDRLQSGQPLTLAPHDLGGAQQDAAALTLAGAGPPPALVEGAASGVDGSLDVGRPCVRDRGDHLAGGGVDHLEAAAVDRVHPRTVHVHPRLIHGCSR